MHISVKSPAKINLTFDVVGSLPDGYHSIVSLFHAITLEDQLSVCLENGQNNQLEIKIEAEFVGEPGLFPLDENNLIARAARAFQEKTGLLSARLLKIKVMKKIPIGAGLAGGSSNAAATLVALNHLFSLPLKDAQLHEIATALGADVPFLIAGGTQLGKGKGEILTAVPVAERFSIVVIKPRQLSVSTPVVFSAYDRWVKEKGTEWKPELDHDRSVQSLIAGDLKKASQGFGNVFEPIVFDMHPALASIKERLLDLGCWSAQLSGSGPSIFAVVADLKMAQAVRQQFEEDERRGESPWLKENGWQVDCFIAESEAAGIRIISEKLS